MTLETSPKGADQTGEAVEKVRIIKISRIMFDEGSLGFSLFPEALEWRERAETTFSQPLGSFFGKASKTLHTLKRRSILTVSDLLALEDEKLKELNNPDEIRRLLSRYLQKLVETPHGKLIDNVFCVEQRKDIPLEREQELIRGVNQALNTLPERQKRILQLRFGLIDGITRTHQEISVLQKPTATPKTIHEDQEKAERALRNPSAEGKLMQYFTLPEKSLAVEAFGSRIVFQKDLILLPTISVADVSTATQMELLTKSMLVLYPTLNAIATADIYNSPLSKLSKEAREDIKNALIKGAPNLAK